MGNAFVVLVSLCIGLASGFIAPSGVLELGEDNQPILSDNNGKESEEAKGATLQDETGTGFIELPFRTNNEKKINLETNENRIKDKELYDQGTTNHNNVNERSFIYINQKYKTPVVNLLYGSQDIMRKPYKSLVSEVAENSKQYPVNFTPIYSIQKTKKDYFGKRVESKNLYFLPANNQDLNKALTPEKKNELSAKRLMNKAADEKREYVELLKPPLLRPLSTLDKKEQMAWPLPDQGLSHYIPYTKKLHVPNLPIDPHQFSMKYYDNYGFPSPYGYQSSALQFRYKPEEVNPATEKTVRNGVNDIISGETNKFLDRYLKESLDERVTHGRSNCKTNNCQYSNCVFQSTKHLNSHAKEECKCVRRVNMLKQRESTGFQSKEPSSEKVTAKTEVDMVNTSKSSEIADYGDLLAEEMNLKKLIDD